MNIPAEVLAGQIVDDSLDMSWGFFDRIYCITLASRPDRLRQAKAQFERVGLANRVEFVVVEKHASNSEEGIFQSHMSCLRDALDAGAGHIAIFEDDIFFHRFSPRSLEGAVEFMRADSDWSLFFFGCFVRSSRRTPHRSVVRVKFRCTAHGYAVSREFARKIVAQTWNGVAYDDMLRAIADDHVYAVYPSFAYQSGSSTDNDNLLDIDKIRRLIGGVRRLQRWNEFTSYHMGKLVAAHVVVVLMLLLTTFLAWHGRRFGHGPPVILHH